MKILQEVFKDIPGYKDFYQVSNFGRVKSLAKSITYINGVTRQYDEKILKPGGDGRGYDMVILCKNRKKTNVKVHKLIAMAFLNYKSDGTNNIVVDHIDNDRSNNMLNNLQLISNRENSTKDKINRSSKYTGVRKEGDKWASTVRSKGLNMRIGVFDKEIDAHLAYQKAIKDLL